MTNPSRFWCGTENCKGLCPPPSRIFRKQSRGSTVGNFKGAGQTGPRIKHRSLPGPTHHMRRFAGPHTRQIQFGTRPPIAAETNDTQPGGLTSPLAAQVLLLFVAFLLFLLSTVANLLTTTKEWRIPLLATMLLRQQHGQSCPATKQDILCCSASISCALIHLNAASVQFKYD